METLLENYETKTKKQHQAEGSKSAAVTIARRLQDLWQNLESQRHAHLKTYVSYPLALNEPCHIRETAQLVFWINFVSEDGDSRRNACNLFAEIQHLCNRHYLCLQKYCITV